MAFTKVGQEGWREGGKRGREGRARWMAAARLPSSPLLQPCPLPSLRQRWASSLPALCRRSAPATSPTPNASPRAGGVCGAPAGRDAAPHLAGRHGAAGRRCGTRAQHPGRRPAPAVPTGHRDRLAGLAPQRAGAGRAPAAASWGMAGGWGALAGRACWRPAMQGGDEPRVPPPCLLMPTPLNPACLAARSWRWWCERCATTLISAPPPSSVLSR